MKDLLIVGRGLAATVIAHSCRRKKISFSIVGEKNLSACSRVGAGIWSPIVFKRLAKSWMAAKLIDHLLDFYTECEGVLGEKILTQRIFIRPFSEEQEKTLWRKKAANELEDFLDAGIYKAQDELKKCEMPIGYSQIRRCGNVDMPTFLDASDRLFGEYIVSEKFEHSHLRVNDHDVCYKNNTAKDIVFCEGHLVSENPFFSFIPLKPVKGELMEVEMDLGIKNHVLNKGGFLMDTGERRFKAGATYNWNDLNDAATEKGKRDIEKKIGRISGLPYKILQHSAGVRPSSADRRPIIGRHPQFDRLHVFNGLGSRGVMLAPYFADNFVHFVLQKEELHHEVDVKRFYHLFHDRAKS